MPVLTHIHQFARPSAINATQCIVHVIVLYLYTTLPLCVPLPEVRWRHLHDVTRGITVEDHNGNKSTRSQRTNRIEIPVCFAAEKHCVTSHCRIINHNLKWSAILDTEHTFLNANILISCYTTFF